MPSRSEIRKANKKRALVDKRLMQICYEEVERVESPLIMDVGAYRGGFLKHCLERNGASRLVAVEPFEDNCKEIKKALPPERTHIYQGIVWPEECSKGLTVARGKGCTLFGKGKRVTVKGLNIFNILSLYDLGWIDVMMMNCEGSEYEILLNRNMWLVGVGMLFLSMHTKKKKYLSNEYLAKRVEITRVLRDYDFKMIGGMDDLESIAHISQLWKR